MKHKTLFRLLLKFLGVWLGCNGVVAVVGILTNWIGNTIMYASRPGGVSYSYPYWLGTASGLVQMGLGLYLFFGGKWIVDMAIPSNRPYCHECGYDLTGAAGSMCNECGTPFHPPPLATEVNRSA